MRKFLAITFFLNSLFLVAQDYNDVLLGVHVPTQSEPMPSSAKSLLETRMYQLVSEKGISGNLYSPRFLLLPRIAVIDKEILGTAPPRVILNLEMTIFVGDIEKEKGNVFGTESITLKGVGQNEQKAYIAAVKNIRPKNPGLLDFLERTKREIIQYYEEHCEEITKKAYALDAQDKTRQAVTVIANIPIASNCYSEHEDEIRTFYQSVLERDCDSLINVAKSKWFTNQTLEGAKAAGEVLADLEPRSYCRDRVNELYTQMSEKVKELGDREWDLKLKIVDAHVDQVEYTRELILKYIENQPKKNYYYRFRDW